MDLSLDRSGGHAISETIVNNKILYTIIFQPNVFSEHHRDGYFFNRVKYYRFQITIKILIFMILYIHRLDSTIDLARLYRPKEH